MEMNGLDLAEFFQPAPVLDAVSLMKFGLTIVCFGASSGLIDGGLRPYLSILGLTIVLNASYEIRFMASALVYLRPFSM